MNPHAQQVADLEALTADFFAGAPLPQGRRVGGHQVAYVLRWLSDLEIASLINSLHPSCPAGSYARAAGRSLSGVEYNHLYVANLARDWRRLPTMEMKIARLRAFNKDLEVAW
jgi:hypothetical protein